MEELIAQVGRHGLALVFANALAERVGVPVPALPALLVAGALAATGLIAVLPLLVIAVGTPLAVDFGWFLLGRWRGERTVRAICRPALAPPSGARSTPPLFAPPRPVSPLYPTLLPA